MNIHEKCIVNEIISYIQVEFLLHILCMCFQEYILGSKQDSPNYQLRACLPIRVTRCVCKKVAQNVAQSIFLWKLTHTFYLEKSSPIICATSVIFTKKYPKSSNTLKFAQSGHPAAHCPPCYINKDFLHKLFFYICTCREWHGWRLCVQTGLATSLLNRCCMISF
jgi:hypothetical protein